MWRLRQQLAAPEAAFGEKVFHTVEHPFSTLADAAPAMIWMSGVDALCNYFNRPWLEFTGRTLAQELGNGWAEGVHADDRTRCVETYLNAFQARKPFSMEYRMRRADGEYRWLLDHGTPYDLPDGSFAGYVGSCVDVTEHKLLETALRQSQEKYRRLIEHAPIGIVVSLNGRVIFCNERECELFGCAIPTDLIGKSTTELIHPDDRPAMLELGRRIRSSETQMDAPVVFRLLRVDGRPITIEATSVLFPFEGETALLSFHQDVTARQLLESARHAGEANLMALIENTDDFIWSVDTNYCLIAANNAYRLQVGQTIGRPTQIGDCVLNPNFSAATLAEWQAYYDRALHGEKFAVEQKTQVEPTDEWIDYHFNPIVADGKIVGVAVQGRNVTERKKIEGVLRQSEANLQALINAANESIFLMEPDGAIVTINETTANRMHSDVSQMQGRNIYDFLLPETKETRQAFVQQVLQNGQTVHFVDQRFERWIENHIYPVLDARGEVVRLAIFGRDITERKRFEEQLAYQANLLANINDAIVASDAQFRLTTWNAAAESMYGWKAAEVLGRIGLEITQTQFYEADKKEMLQRIADEGHWRGEATQVRKDGTRFAVEVSSLVLRDERGQITGYVSVNRDITERKVTEEMLNRLAAIIESTDDAVIGKTLEGRVISWNAGAENLYGYSAAEMVGQSISVLLPPERFDDMPQILETIKNGGHLRQFETKRRTKSGGVLDVSLSISPIKTTTGQVVGISTIARTITERKQMEESERELRVLAEALRHTAAALNSTLKFDDVLDRILENVERVVPHDADEIDIILLDAPRQIAQVVRHRNTRDLPPTPPLQNQTQKVEALCFPVSQMRNLLEMQVGRAPVIIDDTKLYDGWIANPLSDWIRANLGVPIVIRGETLGFLSLSSAEPHAFSLRDADRLCAFADQAAIAIENARLYAEVQKLAVTDGLTGLVNRAGLLQLGEREVERAVRFQHPLAVVMLDIDFFKRVNDTYGHPVGDRVLQALARCCQEQVRTVDVLARYGGEELILLLPETDLACAAQVAERMRKSIEILAVTLDSEAEVPGASIYVTVSLGVVGLNLAAPTLRDLLARADQALYAAKQNGRNQVVVKE